MMSSTKKIQRVAAPAL
jgi:hypothetical protein